MFERDVRLNLIAIAAAYCEATGKSLTQVSLEFYGRGDFFTKFRARKRSLSIKSVDTMIRKFRKEWPADAKWPTIRPIFIGDYIVDSLGIKRRPK